MHLATLLTCHVLGLSKHASRRHEVEEWTRLLQFNLGHLLDIKVRKLAIRLVVNELLAWSDLILEKHDQTIVFFQCRRGVCVDRIARKSDTVILLKLAQVSIEVIDFRLIGVLGLPGVDSPESALGPLLAFLFLLYCLKSLETK